MKLSRMIQGAAATLSICGMLVGTPLVAAAELQTGLESDPPAGALVHDVALAPGGTLRGQLSDVGGAPLAGKVVSVRQDGRELTATATSTDGTFHVANLQGGAYQLAADGQIWNYRFWTAEAAPPNAQKSVLCIVDGQRVRGNFAKAQVVSAVAAIALILGVGYAIYEIADDDDPPGS